MFRCNGEVRELRVRKLKESLIDICNFRNGGHIAPVLYAQYGELKEKYGVEVAKEIIRFRAGHLPEMLKVAAEEKVSEESQCREVQVFEVFHDVGLYGEAKVKLAEYQKDVESPSFQVHEGREAIKVINGDTCGDE